MIKVRLGLIFATSLDHWKKKPNKAYFIASTPSKLKEVIGMFNNVLLTKYQIQSIYFCYNCFKKQNPKYLFLH